MRRSRLTSDLGQVVIDTMVGMDKDSSSVGTVIYEVTYVDEWNHVSMHDTLRPLGI